MLIIDDRYNITLNTGDNAIIDFSLCCCEDKLTDGDTVIFHSGEQQFETGTFVDGVAKLQIMAEDEPFDGRYCIRVHKKDGRKQTVIDGKFVRKGGC